VIIVAGVLAVLAALVHVYIFVLESLRWTDASTRRVFGTTAEDAQTTRAMAYNQGFYNLFLAVGAVVGVALLGPDRHAGTALVVLSTGSMLAAALVLVTSDRTKARPALVQGALPALALLALAAAAL
jgi:putative membrane protein